MHEVLQVVGIAAFLRRAEQNHGLRDEDAAPRLLRWNGLVHEHIAVVPCVDLAGN
jgi:hypothetical protein